MGVIMSRRFLIFREIVRTVFWVGLVVGVWFLAGILGNLLAAWAKSITG
jgi:hypothetical protein